ncbi:UNVERIFIED_CONTAM: Root phototropism protein 3 [Sesamum radiatum]|uniref:Root phototropism protein 3 n=1 Tax=Sesamum radiatum TaxID=300843 RepID=A0AAW2VJ78_SESRA
MQNMEVPEFSTSSDMDYFINTLSDIKVKEAKTDLIASTITHYASKWLPELSEDEGDRAVARYEDSQESVTASWTKKRFFIQALVGILPPEKDSIPCNFLLRLLRVANMVHVGPSYRAELEKRVSWQLDQASLKELMIPSFSHTSTALLDFELVLRLVKRFASMEDVARSGAAVMKVAKLVDSYLAEAAVDSHLLLADFVDLASALPSHARSSDDGLYRAIDTYLKAHPSLSKQERKTLCSLIDSRKLSQEASLHAAQNERLPVRAVIQVLLSEQTKLIKHVDWSGSLSGTRSPAGVGLELPGRCFSKRETSTVQQMEIKRLKEDVLRLQSQCMAMERQIEKLVEKKRSTGSYFSWKKLAGFKANRVGEVGGENEGGAVLKSPLEIKTRLLRGKNSSNRRKSMS